LPADRCSYTSTIAPRGSQPPSSTTLCNAPAPAVLIPPIWRPVGTEPMRKRHGASICLCSTLVPTLLDLRPSSPPGTGAAAPSPTTLKTRGRATAHSARWVRHVNAYGKAATGSSSRDAQAASMRARANADEVPPTRFLHPALRELFNETIAIHPTAFEDTDPDTNELVFIGSKTEMALLKFAKELGWADYKKTREAADIVQMVPFSSSRKAMGAVVKLGDGSARATYVTVTRGGDASEPAGVETREIDDLARDNVSRATIFYANQMLRAIMLCYRDFESWPPAGASYTADDEVEYEDLARDLTLIAITGIEDPLREGVREAVANCFKAGVTVKIIFSEGGPIMEGPVFRKLNDQELLEAVPRLQDKKLLVEKLRELGEIVGVTGDGTNDGPALKTADVGFSMGITGTEAAKEASDIILMDDNLALIVKAIIWGGCMNDVVHKFLQLSTNVRPSWWLLFRPLHRRRSGLLSAVQLLWIDIIMDTFAVLALATDPASPVLLDRSLHRSDTLSVNHSYLHSQSSRHFGLASSMTSLYSRHERDHERDREEARTQPTLPPSGHLGLPPTPLYIARLPGVSVGDGDGASEMERDRVSRPKGSRAPSPAGRVPQSNYRSTDHSSSLSNTPPLNGVTNGAARGSREALTHRRQAVVAHASEDMGADADAGADAEVGADANADADLLDAVDAAEANNF
ncbi:hypothetical protein EVJ58_g9067, partial [Rhodofomes roseus]